MALAPARKIIANLGLSSKSLSGSGPSSAGFISKYLNRGDIFGQDSIYYDNRAGYTMLINEEPYTIISQNDVVVVL